MHSREDVWLPSLGGGWVGGWRIVGSLCSAVLYIQGQGIFKVKRVQTMSEICVNHGQNGQPAKREGFVYDMCRTVGRFQTFSTSRRIWVMWTEDNLVRCLIYVDFGVLRYTL